MPRSVSFKNADDYVVNPITGLLIKVGGKVYHQLLKDKALGMDTETREDTVVLSSGATDEIKKHMKAPKNTVLIRRDDKIYAQRRKMTKDEYMNNAILKSAEVVKHHLHEFNDDMTDEQIATKIKQLVVQKMVGNVPARPEKQSKYRVLKTNDRQTYEISDSSSDGDDHDENGMAS
jgi:hypothetical protein